MSPPGEHASPDRFGPLHLGQLLALIGAGLLVLGAFAIDAPERSLPDFDLDGPVELRKQAFFDYLAPRVVDANAEVRAQRQRLLDLEDEIGNGRAPRWWDRRWLQRLARDYELDADAVETVDELVAALKFRVDTVPPSLALVQAAIESGWGRSRFARQANNLFGHWCYEKGCGLVPQQRDDGARHEVAAFATTRQAVARYLHNLNTHPPYRPFRELRAKARATGQALDAQVLTRGLLQYSERRGAYLEELEDALRANATLNDAALARVPRDWIDA
jgi:Bax protein